MKKIISLLLFFLIFQSVLLEKKSIKRSGKFAKLFEKIKKERSLRKLQGTDSTDQEASEVTLPAETPFTPPAENEAESGSALAANGTLSGTQGTHIDEDIRGGGIHIGTGDREITRHDDVIEDYDSLGADNSYDFTPHLTTLPKDDYVQFIRLYPSKRF